MPPTLAQLHVEVLIWHLNNVRFRSLTDFPDACAPSGLLVPHDRQHRAAPCAVAFSPPGLDEIIIEPNLQKLRRIRRFEFTQHIPPVGLDGVQCDKKLLSNLETTLAFCQQAENLQLAV